MTMNVRTISEEDVLGSHSTLPDKTKNGLRSGRVGKDRPPKIVLVTKAAWVVLAVLLPILSSWMLKFHEESVARRLGAEQEQATIARHKIADSNVVAILLPEIVRGPRERRERAMRLLAIFAPDTAIAVSKQMLESQLAQAEKAFATQIQNLSEQNKEERGFLQHVELGRQFERLELFGQATAEFRQAAKAVPGRFRPLAKKEFLQQAESAYAAKNFPEAARAFREAFSSVIDTN